MSPDSSDGGLRHGGAWSDRDGAVYHPMALTNQERDAVELAADAFSWQSEHGAGLRNSGPNDCAEIAVTLRGLLQRLPCIERSERDGR